MITLTKQLELHIPSCLYLKNPKDSALGNKIVMRSAQLIHSMGIEEFTFKKLSIAIGCTEATVYRYFENKHQLLLYIMNIFWGWHEYQIVFATQNLDSASVKLKRTIALLAKPEFNFLKDKKYSQDVLQTAINEGIKIHLTRHLRDEIKTGGMESYYRLVKRISQFILELDASYPFPDALSAAIIDNALLQLFYKKYCPGISDASISHENIENFLTQLLPKKLK